MPGFPSACKVHNMTAEGSVVLESGNCYFQTIVNLDGFLEGRTNVDNTAYNRQRMKFFSIKLSATPKVSQHQIL